MASNAAFINRSLTTIHNELEFLRDSGVISEAFYESWVTKLPKKYTPGAPPIDVFTSSTPSEKQEYSPSSVAPPSGPPPPHSPVNGGEQAEVLYNYEARDPTDLPLYVGQRVAILERLNPDWWRGRDVQTGREGIFPCSYVKVVDGGRWRMAGPPPVPSYGGPPPVSLAPSAAPDPPYYPPPSTNYYQNAGPSQPMQQQPVMVEQQPQQQHHEALKKFGSKLGNAAIFGAGATLGGDLVNSIL